METGFDEFFQGCDFQSIEAAFSGSETFVKSAYEKFEHSRFIDRLIDELFSLTENETTETNFPGLKVESVTPCIDDRGYSWKELKGVVQVPAGEFCEDGGMIRLFIVDKEVDWKRDFGV